MVQETGRSTAGGLAEIPTAFVELFGDQMKWDARQFDHHCFTGFCSTDSSMAMKSPPVAKNSTRCLLRGKSGVRREYDAIGLAGIPSTQ